MNFVFIFENKPYVSKSVDIFVTNLKANYQSITVTE
jgi:hypothetical protein